MSKCFALLSLSHAVILFYFLTLFWRRYRNRAKHNLNLNMNIVHCLVSLALITIKKKCDHNNNNSENNNNNERKRNEMGSSSRRRKKKKTLLAQRRKQERNMVNKINKYKIKCSPRTAESLVCVDLRERLNWHQTCTHMWFPQDFGLSLPRQHRFCRRRHQSHQRSGLRSKLQLTSAQPALHSAAACTSLWPWTIW